MAPLLGEMGTNLDDIPNTRIHWTRVQADQATQHLVYIFWTKDKNALYVGKSRRGVMRPLDPAHNVAVRAREEADALEFILCDDAQEAERIEKRLIYQLNPAYNQRGKVAIKHTKPKPEYVPRPHKRDDMQADIDYMRWLNNLATPH